MTDFVWREHRLRCQLSDALGGGALADIFTMLWDSIDQDDDTQLHAIGCSTGKLIEATRRREHVSPYDLAVLSAGEQKLESFRNQFPKSEQYSTLILALKLGYPATGDHDIANQFVSTLFAWAHTITS